MANLESTNGNETKKRKKRNKGVIKFDEETVKKENAVEVLKRKSSKRSNGDVHNSEPDFRTNNIQQETQNEIDNDLEKTNVPEGKTKKKSKKRKQDEEAKSVTECDTQEEQNDGDQHIGAENSVDSTTEKKKKKKSKKSNFDEEAENGQSEATESKQKKIKKSDIAQESEKIEKIVANPEKPGVKPKDSKRAQKKMKHAKLLEEKKLKDVVATQQTVLNYLSKWKHCREEWKFEKRKQIWLSQNMLDCSKIPNEFWETAVEYFSGAKGFIRKLVLRDALKVIEDEEKLDEENVNEDQQTKVRRARDIIQNLQE